MSRNETSFSPTLVIINCHREHNQAISNEPSFPRRRESHKVYANFMNLGKSTCQNVIAKQFYQTTLPQTPSLKKWRGLINMCRPKISLSCRGTRHLSRQYP